MRIIFWTFLVVMTGAPCSQAWELSQITAGGRGSHFQNYGLGGQGFLSAEVSQESWILGAQADTLNQFGRNEYQGTVFGQTEFESGLGIRFTMTFAPSALIFAQKSGELSAFYPVKIAALPIELRGSARRAGYSTLALSLFTYGADFYLPRGWVIAPTGFRVVGAAQTLDAVLLRVSKYVDDVQYFGAYVSTIREINFIPNPDQYVVIGGYTLGLNGKIHVGSRQALEPYIEWSRRPRIPIDRVVSGGLRWVMTLAWGE